jgi:hypothetical protein
MVASEAARLLTLAIAGWWLLGRFATAQAYGAGDAFWYSSMLGDFLQQVRAGGFPVFVGQTEFAFNGAVYPLRVAPWYQHLGAALDLCTGRSLSVVEIQNLVLLVSGGLALTITYFALCWLAPTRRWPAVGLAVLYVSCPGVLALAYTQDLHMSWVATPFLPLVCAANLRSFRREGGATLLVLAAGLALLWLAHAPTALWATLITAALQALRLVTAGRTLPSLQRVAWAGGAAILLGHYPFVSLATLDIRSEGSALGAGFAAPEKILHSLEAAFPRLLLPLSSHARQLGDIQPGYGILLLVFTVLAAAAARRLAPDTRIACLGAALSLGLVVVLLPIPGFAAFFWLNLPDALQRLTYYWPMQRLVPIAAGLAVVAYAALPLPTDVRSRVVRTFGGLLLLACLWSLWEARQFRRAAHERTASVEQTRTQLRPENRPLMNHAYGLADKLPSTFSHGVTDPFGSGVFLAADLASPTPQTPEATAAEAQPWSARVDANPGILNLFPQLTLQPGRRYRLNFEFNAFPYTGVLQLNGTEFRREYLLPASGEPQAFGSAPGHPTALDLWTTRDTPVEIHVRFIPTAAGARAVDFSNFGSFRFADVTDAPAVVKVQKLAPWTAAVAAPAAGWVETPRLFLAGYHATRDGVPVPVSRSQNGLVKISVEPGDQQVTLHYRAPLVLRASYYLTLVAWTLLGVSALIGLSRNLFAHARSRGVA